MNPIDVNEDYLQKLKELPVNRISLGAQSFLDTELKLLNRLHKSSETIEAVRIIRKSGFDNISLDLMYGLPGQRIEEVIHSVKQVIKLEPQHISTYLLGLEKSSSLFKFKHKIPEDNILAEFYFSIREMLLNLGYNQYEISNFSLKNRESQHNISYWNDQYYIGLGPSASGYLPGLRYMNPNDLIKYREKINQGKIMSEKELITPETHEKEYIMLQLRTVNGLNLDKFRTKFNNDFIDKYRNLIEKYKRSGFIEIKNNLIRLSPKAYFISNEILCEFM